MRECYASQAALEQARDRQTRVSRQWRAGRARARQVRNPGGSEQPGASSGARSGPGERVEQQQRGQARVSGRAADGAGARPSPDGS
jgi:hypothetical protein